MSRHDPKVTEHNVEFLEKALIDRLEAARLLRVRDVADTLAVSTRTVRRLINAGKLPHTRVASEIRVPQAALLAYIKANTYGGTP